MKPLKLESVLTVYDDLHTFLNNERCKTVIEKRDSGGLTRRYYDYGDYDIPIPIENYEGQGFINDYIGMHKSTPSWYSFYWRGAKAIWDASVGEQLQKKYIKIPDKTGYAAPGITYSMAIDYIIRQGLLKNELASLFEHENWVVPYFIYWEKKDLNTMYAVLNMDPMDPEIAVINREMVKKIEQVFKSRRFDKKDHLQLIVKMKREDETK